MLIEVNPSLTTSELLRQLSLILDYDSQIDQILLGRCQILCEVVGATFEEDRSLVQLQQPPEIVVQVLGFSDALVFLILCVVGLVAGLADNNRLVKVRIDVGFNLVFLDAVAENEHLLLLWIPFFVKFQQRLVVKGSVVVEELVSRLFSQDLA